MAAGLVLSASTSRLLMRAVSFAYHVNAGTYTRVIPLVLVVTLIAAFLPARRAVRGNPTEALRYE